MYRKLIPLALALMLMVASSGSTAAYVLYNDAWFYSSAFTDHPSDGTTILRVCFEPNSQVYDHRANLIDAANQAWGRFGGHWPDPSSLVFASNGTCDGPYNGVYYEDASDIQVRSDHLACNLLGLTDRPSAHIHAKITMNYEMPSRCGDTFDWNQDNGIGSTDYSAATTFAHEIGHALGIDHADARPVYNSELMYSNNAFPTACNRGESIDFISRDDFNALWARYPGLPVANDGGYSWPVGEPICQP